MVQVGGLEPPTSGSTDQRSNQLSYTCPDASLETRRGEPRFRGSVWQAARAGAKSPGAGRPGFKKLQIERAAAVQAAFLKAVVRPSFIGSAVSAATFCACWVRSLACAVKTSNCLRR